MTFHHHMFPAPGVYDALTTLLVMTVSACTTPLNFDMPAFTVTVPAETSTLPADTVTFAAAFTVTPDESRVTVLPLESAISIFPGPSPSVTFWPAGVSSTSDSRPSVSSRVIFTPLRERITLRGLPLLIESGGESLPFHNPPSTNGRR